MAKVMRKDARHTQRRDRASGVPLENHPWHKGVGTESEYREQERGWKDQGGRRSGSQLIGAGRLAAAFSTLQSLHICSSTSAGEAPGPPEACSVEMATRLEDKMLGKASFIPLCCSGVF